MAIEIERKFLVKGEEYKKDVYKTSHIVQAYICFEDNRVVRVRILDDRGFLTIKGKNDGTGLSRYEWEKEIPLEDAEALLPLSATPVIDKVRHYIRNKDGVHTWEVDEFHGPNEGLTVAEIELLSENDSFDKPGWLGEEVTGEKKYYNSQLSQKPYENW